MSSEIKDSKDNKEKEALLKNAADLFEKIMKQAKESVEKWKKSDPANAKKMSDKEMILSTEINPGSRSFPTVHLRLKFDSAADITHEALRRFLETQNIPFKEGVDTKDGKFLLVIHPSNALKLFISNAEAIKSAAQDITNQTAKFQYVRKFGLTYPIKHILSDISGRIEEGQAIVWDQKSDTEVANLIKKPLQLSSSYNFFKDKNVDLKDFQDRVGQSLKMISKMLQEKLEIYNKDRGQYNSDPKMQKDVELGLAFIRNYELFLEMVKAGASPEAQAGTYAALVNSPLVSALNLPLRGEVKLKTESSSLLRFSKQPKQEERIRIVYNYKRNKDTKDIKEHKESKENSELGIGVAKGIDGELCAFIPGPYNDPTKVPSTVKLESLKEVTIRFSPGIKVEDAKETLMRLGNLFTHHKIQAEKLILIFSTETDKATVLDSDKFGWIDYDINRKIEPQVDQGREPEKGRPRSS